MPTIPQLKADLKEHLTLLMANPNPFYFRNNNEYLNYPKYQSVAWEFLNLPPINTDQEWEEDAVEVGTNNANVNDIINNINTDFVVSKDGQNLGLSGMLRFLVQTKMIETGSGTVPIAPPRFPIKVKDADLGIDRGAETQVKRPPLGNRFIQITINNRYFTQGETKLGLVACYLHEVVHAYLEALKQAKENTMQGWANCISPTILEDFLKIGDQGETQQHELMVREYTLFMAEWLKAYADANAIDIPNEYQGLYGNRPDYENGLLFFKDLAYGQFSTLSESFVLGAMGNGATHDDYIRAMTVLSNEVIACQGAPNCSKTLDLITP